MNNRIVFIDITRSFAIVLALFDHAMNDFQVWKQYDLLNYSILKSITSTATPTFLIMFGMMLELVYRKRLMQNKVFDLIQSSLSRSLKCYIGGTIVSIAGLIGGIITFKRLMAVSLFLTNNHFGGILFLYCLLILLSVPLVIMRHYGGFKALLLLNVIIWAIYYLLGFSNISSTQFNYFFSLIIGVGGERGPSVLQSITFCTIGMYLAQHLVGYDKIKFVKSLLFTSAVLIVSIIFIINIFQSGDIFTNYITNIYRYNNHPLYYLIGSQCAILWIGLFSLLFSKVSSTSKIIFKFTVFSRKSLEAFTLGSVLLNLFYYYLPGIPLDFIGPILFVIFCLLLLLWYEKLIKGTNVVQKIRSWYYSIIVNKYVAQLSDKLEKYYRSQEYRFNKNAIYP